MKVVIVGNGIIALTTAYRLLKKDNTVNITIVGNNKREGCATLAAGAMFNSFCEIDSNTFVNSYEKAKWNFNRTSTALWQDHIKNIEQDSGIQQETGFGTYLIQNTTTDELEDENFEAIHQALVNHNEPFEWIAPKSINNYSPNPTSRASRCLFIPNEGWINPNILLNSLETILQKSKRVDFVNAHAKAIHKGEKNIDSLETNQGNFVTGDCFLLANGAAFSQLVDDSNLRLNFQQVYYGIGCSIVLKTNEYTVKNCIRTPNRGLACGIYAVPQNSENTVVGASNFIAPWAEQHPRATSLHTLLDAAINQINSNFYKAQVLRVNTGWRPTTEDTLPMIGETSIPNLFVATGTKRDGIHCSPLVSDYLSDIMLRNQSKHDFKLFTPERKPHRIYTREEAIRLAVKHTLNADYQHGFSPAKNNMQLKLKTYYTDLFHKIHDQVGAYNWGIPPELMDLYKYKK